MEVKKGKEKESNANFCMKGQIKLNSKQTKKTPLKGQRQRLKTNCCGVMRLEKAQKCQNNVHREADNEKVEHEGSD